MKAGGRRHSNSSNSSIDSSGGNENEYCQNYYCEDDRHLGKSLSSSAASCSSSSLSSTNNIHHRHSNYYSKDHLSTDLRLGLTLSNHHQPHSSPSSFPRGQYSDWPPIKGHLRNTLASGKSSTNISRPRDHDHHHQKQQQEHNSLFVKVYMQGIPIGRKLDLLSLDGYSSLVSTLSLMFQTIILYPDVAHDHNTLKYHILTYEDKEGDWMMVGDVPWEMFLSNVKRLKIATLDGCQ